MRTILALLLLTTSAAFAQITPLRNAVLQNRLEANGHPIQNVGNLTVTAGNVTVGTASLGTPEILPVNEENVFTVTASAQQLLAANATITISTWGPSMQTLRVVEGDGGLYLQGREVGTEQVFNEVWIEETDSVDGFANSLFAFLDWWVNGLGRDGEILTVELYPYSNPPPTASHPSLLNVERTRGPAPAADAVPPSGTGVIVTTTGNVTRIVDGTVQQSAADVFTQEGTGKLWRLKITGTESAPVLTLQSID